MAVSAAQQRAKQKWDKQNLDRIQLVVRAGEKEQIRAAAEAAGETLNHFIVQATKERMEKLKADQVDQPSTEGE